MLCPEVSKFPPPKTVVSRKENVDVDAVTNLIQMNHFYKSVVVTCPDELNIDFVQEALSEDSDYYRISNCALTEFVDSNFIQYFVKKGKVICLSAGKNCVVQNCAAITPDGILTLHVLEYIYQTLGLEGTKRPHSYYEIKVDLQNLKSKERVTAALSKLEESDFYLTWEPVDDKVCPSSIAKYFCDRNIAVSVHSITFRKVSPHITQVPTLVDTDIDEVVEWMGMLAHEADVTPKEDYISTYNEPLYGKTLDSARITILIAKGFLSNAALAKLCHSLKEYAESRELEDYWVAMSVQGNEESLWQLTPSSQRMFQSHRSSANIFFNHNGCTIYSISSLKYS